MPRPWSRDQRSRRDSGQADARRLWAAGEDVEARALERRDGRQATARERRDGAACPSAKAASELVAAREQAARPLGLEGQQPTQRLVRPVELGDAEPAPVLRG